MLKYDSTAFKKIN